MTILPIPCHNERIMGILFHYVAKRLALTTMFITCGLVSFVWMAQSLRFIEMIVKYRVHLLDYLQLVLCLLPDLLVILMPIGLGLGCLSTLRYLSLHHEWKAMQAAGLSPWILYRPFMAISFLGAVLTFINCSEVAPWSFRYLRVNEFKIRSQWMPSLSGSFQSAKNVTVYAQQQGRNGHLEHIFIDAPPYTFMAESGQMLRQGDQLGCHLHAGYRLERHPNGSITQMEFDDVYYDFSAFSEQNKQNNKRSMKPAEQPLRELIFPSTEHSIEHQNKMKGEGHQRLLQPLLALLDVWIAFSLSSAMMVGLCIGGVHLVVMAGIPFLVRVPWLIVLPYAFIMGVLSVGWFRLYKNSKRVTQT